MSEPVPFKTFAADIERRKLARSLGPVPRNSGRHRTESKRALLKAIEELGGKW